MRVTRKVGWDPFNEVTLCIHSRHLLWQLEMINVGKCVRVLTGNWHDPLQSIYKRGSLGRRGLSMINQSCYEILIVDLSLVFWGKDIKKKKILGTWLHCLGVCQTLSSLSHFNIEFLQFWYFWEFLWPSKKYMKIYFLEYMNTYFLYKYIFYSNIHFLYQYKTKISCSPKKNLQILKLNNSLSLKNATWRME